MQGDTTASLPSLLDPKHLRDPYAGDARLREDSPVQEITPGGIIAVSRADDVAHVLRHPKIFSSRGFAAALNPEWLPYPNPLRIGMITKDGAEHTRLRTLVNRAFLPKRVADFEPRIRVIAAELADHLAAAGDVDFLPRTPASCRPGSSRRWSVSTRAGTRTWSAGSLSSRRSTSLGPTMRRSSRSR
jgi:cytochrome P450